MLNLDASMRVVDTRMTPAIFSEWSQYDGCWWYHPELIIQIIHDYSRFLRP